MSVATQGTPSTIASTRARGSASLWRRGGDERCGVLRLRQPRGHQYDRLSVRDAESAEPLRAVVCHAARRNRIRDRERRRIRRQTVFHRQIPFMFADAVQRGGPLRQAPLHAQESLPRARTDRVVVEVETVRRVDDRDAAASGEAHQGRGLRRVGVDEIMAVQQLAQAQSRLQIAPGTNGAFQVHPQGGPTVRRGHFEQPLPLESREGGRPADAALRESPQQRLDDQGRAADAGPGAQQHAQAGHRRASSRSR